MGPKKKTWAPTYLLFFSRSAYFHFSLFSQYLGGNQDGFPKDFRGIRGPKSRENPLRGRGGMGGQPAGGREAPRGGAKANPEGEQAPT